MTDKNELREALEKIAALDPFDDGAETAGNIARDALAALDSTPAPVGEDFDQKLSAMCDEGWKFHAGPPPEYDSPLAQVYDAGIGYAWDQLASILGVTDYEGGDGSEDYETDVANTGRNILVAAGFTNADGDLLTAADIVRLATPAPEGASWFYAQEVATPAPDNGEGWVYFNPDTGSEYARNHPVESGECIDATDVRPSTLMEDALNERVQELFHASLATPAPVSPPPSDEGLVELVTKALWADGQMRLGVGPSPLPASRSDFRERARAVIERAALSPAKEAREGEEG